MTEYTHSGDERAFWARLSDEHIRDGYATIENQGGEYVSPIRRAAFESWLAAHDARVHRAAQADALREAAEDVRTGVDMNPTTLNGNWDYFWWTRYLTGLDSMWRHRLRTRADRIEED